MGGVGCREMRAVSAEEGLCGGSAGGRGTVVPYPLPGAWRETVTCMLHLGGRLGALLGACVGALLGAILGALSEALLGALRRALLGARLGARL